MREIWLPHEGVNLFAVEDGDGLPIILLHGGLSTHLGCRLFAGPLASRFRIITPDLRASGRSHFADPLTWEQLAGDVAALARHLGLERAVIGGVSFGAGVALRVALDHPALVDGLVLLHPAYGGADMGLTPAQQEAMQAMDAAGSRVIAEGIAMLLPLFDALPAPLRERARAVASTYDPASVATLTRFMVSAVQPFASAAELGAITAPTLLVPGVDPYHPVEVADRLRAHVPRCTVVEATDFGTAITTFVTQLAVACAILALAACRLDYASDCAPAGPGGALVCRVPGWVDRAFDVRACRARRDGSSALPVIVALHGGGSQRRAADLVACPGGDEHDAGCLVTMATARGYVVVMPDGTGSKPLRGVRTWNGGGGVNGFSCMAGAACNAEVDDIRYIDDMFDELAHAVPIDASRVYVTGISNGGAMAHRLACEDHDRFAAIVPVAGANQFADAGGACTVRTPLLAIHGLDDPTWVYAGREQRDGRMTGVDDTMEHWRVRNGCAATFVDEPLPDRDPNDGTTTVRRRWDACAVATELLRVDGGGHTWPNGYQYFDVDRIGRTERDFGNELILDFFDAHPHL